MSHRFGVSLSVESRNMFILIDRLVDSGDHLLSLPNLNSVTQIIFGRKGKNINAFEKRFNLVIEIIGGTKLNRDRAKSGGKLIYFYVKKMKSFVDLAGAQQFCFHCTEALRYPNYPEIIAQMFIKEGIITSQDEVQHIINNHHNQPQGGSAPSPSPFSSPLHDFVQYDFPHYLHRLSEWFTSSLDDNPNELAKHIKSLGFEILSVPNISMVSDLLFSKKNRVVGALEAYFNCSVNLIGARKVNFARENQRPVKYIHFVATPMTQQQSQTQGQGQSQGQTTTMSSGTFSTGPFAPSPSPSLSSGSPSPSPTLSQSPPPPARISDLMSFFAEFDRIVLDLLNSPPDSFHIWKAKLIQLFGRLNIAVEPHSNPPSLGASGANSPLGEFAQGGNPPMQMHMQQMGVNMNMNTFNVGQNNMGNQMGGMNIPMGMNMNMNANNLNAGNFVPNGGNAPFGQQNQQNVNNPMQMNVNPHLHHHSNQMNSGSMGNVNMGQSNSSQFLSSQLQSLSLNSGHHSHSAMGIGGGQGGMNMGNVGMGGLLNQSSSQQHPQSGPQFIPQGGQFGNQTGFQRSMGAFGSGLLNHDDDDAFSSPSTHHLNPHSLSQSQSQSIWTTSRSGSSTPGDGMSHLSSHSDRERENSQLNLNPRGLLNIPSHLLGISTGFNSPHSPASVNNSTTGFLSPPDSAAILSSNPSSLHSTPSNNSVSNSPNGSTRTVMGSAAYHSGGAIPQLHLHHSQGGNVGHGGYASATSVSSSPPVGFNFSGQPLNIQLDQFNQFSMKSNSQSAPTGMAGGLTESDAAAPSHGTVDSIVSLVNTSPSCLPAFFGYEGSHLQKISEFFRVKIIPLWDDGDKNLQMKKPNLFFQLMEGTDENREMVLHLFKKINEMFTTKADHEKAGAVMQLLKAMGIVGGHSQSDTSLTDLDPYDEIDSQRTYSFGSMRPPNIVTDEHSAPHRGGSIGAPHQSISSVGNNVNTFMNMTSQVQRQLQPTNVSGNGSNNGSGTLTPQGLITSSNNSSPSGSFPTTPSGYASGKGFPFIGPGRVSRIVLVPNTTEFIGMFLCGSEVSIRERINRHMIRVPLMNYFNCEIQILGENSSNPLRELQMIGPPEQVDELEKLFNVIIKTFTATPSRQAVKELLASRGIDITAQKTKKFTTSSNPSNVNPLVASMPGGLLLPPSAPSNSSMMNFSSQPQSVNVTFPSGMASQSFASMSATAPSTTVSSTSSLMGEDFPLSTSLDLDSEEIAENLVSSGETVFSCNNSFPHALLGNNELLTLFQQIYHVKLNQLRADSPSPSRLLYFHVTWSPLYRSQVHRKGVCSEVWETMKRMLDMNNPEGEVKDLQQFEFGSKEKDSLHTLTAFLRDQQSKFRFTPPDVTPTSVTPSPPPMSPSFDESSDSLMFPPTVTSDKRDGLVSLPNDPQLYPLIFHSSFQLQIRDAYKCELLPMGVAAEKERAFNAFQSPSSSPKMLSFMVKSPHAESRQRVDELFDFLTNVFQTKQDISLVESALQARGIHIQPMGANVASNESGFKYPSGIPISNATLQIPSDLLVQSGNTSNSGATSTIHSVFSSSSSTLKSPYFYFNPNPNSDTPTPTTPSPAPERATGSGTQSTSSSTATSPSMSSTSSASISISPLSTTSSSTAALPVHVSSIRTIGDLLNVLKLSHHSSYFEQHGLDLEAFNLLEESHVDDMQLPLGAKLKLKRALKAFKTGSNVAAAGSPNVTSGTI